MNIIKTKNYSKSAFTKLFLLFSIASTFATNYYVDPVNGSNSNSGLSTTLAKANVQQAANLTLPGDTVFLMDGVHLSSPSNTDQSILTISRSGSEGAYITYKAYPGHSPKIALRLGLPYQIWRAVGINASYIIFDGIEVEGVNSSGVTYEEAYQTWQDYENNIKDWNKISALNAAGVKMGVREGLYHHIIVRNCKIHDCGGGLGASGSDYITMENNIIYNNSWHSMYASSGISIIVPKSFDNVTSYKIFILNNIVYNNKTLIPWEQTNALSDGNGIILDINDGNGVSTPAYVGRYLVANNVSYNNGGGGIHAYKAAHIDIINNTTYNNGTVVGYPEIDANNCSDIKIYNNIMYARTGGNANGNDAGAIYDYNLYFNSTAGPFKKGPNDLIGNPQFTTLATDATANFRLNSNSPAINNGSNLTGQFSTTDILGLARPIGFLPDMGAYEYPVVIPRAEMSIKQGATDIADNTGTYNFDDVSTTSPKVVTFTIQNLGDQVLNLTGIPKVTVTGTGFSLQTDAPATVSAAGSATFQVVLTPTITGPYTGTISVISDDANENPYNFAISGYGYDGNKALQTLTFNALPVKVIGDADFDPAATSSASLTVTYVSSNTNVATIINGKIRIVNAGASTITASQAGDGSTNPAKSITQELTVTPVLPAPGSNLITNPTFDTNLTGWSFANKNTATATVESVVKAGFSGNAIKLTTTAIGTNTGIDNVQYGIRVFLVKDKNYLIQFKASADAVRNIGLSLIRDASPYSAVYSKTIALTTTPTVYGTYAFTSNYTGYVAFRFLAANNTTPVYVDEVQINEDVFLGIDTPIMFDKSQAKIYVYPNPVAALLKIDFDSEIGQQATVRVIDLQGQVVITKKQLAIYGKNTIELNLSSLANGIYLVKTTENNINYNTAKVLVKH